MVFGIWLCNLYYISYYTQQGIWTINHHVWPKYEFIIHNNFSTSEKVPLLLSPHIKIQHICFEWFWTVFFFLVNGARFVHNSLLVQLASTFSLERVIFWYGMEVDGTWTCVYRWAFPWRSVYRFRLMKNVP